LRKLAVYFALLLTWYGESSFMGGESTRDAALATLRMGAVALAPLALVCLFAWLSSRTTFYTITDRRLVFSVGIALPVTINLPFAKVACADLQTWRDGSGSIVLALIPTERLAYLAIWPHARPWRLARAEPMLRCIPEAERVAHTLARALATSAGMAVRASPHGAPVSATERPAATVLA
jgi:Bacterial PH domain